MLGFLLLLGNSIAFVLTLAIGFNGMRHMAHELSLERLQWASDGRGVQLEPPAAEGGYHVFISHGIA